MTMSDLCARLTLRALPCVFLATIPMGCTPSLPPITPASYQSIDPAVTDTDNAQIVRVLAYRTPAPAGGECVDENYAVGFDHCLDGVKTVPITAKYPPKGEFRFSSNLVSISVSGTGQAGGSSGQAGYNVSTHRLLMEWSRFRVESYSGTKRLRPELGYVSATERGIAIRVLFDVKLRDANAKTNLSFGFGQLAASLVSGNAEVLVRYETVGIKRDILPKATVAVTSVNDLVNVQSSFYDAIASVSKSWSDGIEPQPSGTAVAAAPAAVDPPAPAVPRVAAKVAPPLAPVAPLAEDHISDAFDFDEIIAYYVTRGTKQVEAAATKQVEKEKTLQTLQQQQQQQMQQQK